MAKYKKTNSHSILPWILLLLGGAVGIGAVGYFTNGFKTNPFDKTETSDSGMTTDSIISNGISVKALTTKDNGDGTVTKTFTYTVQPEGATNQEITVKAQYKGGEDCSAVVTATVDTGKKTVSVTNKADFDKQVEVILTSVDNPEATATVTVDYVKKVKSVSVNDTLDPDVGEVLDYTFNLENGFYTPTYSKYTKDKSYTFTLSDVSLTLQNYQIQDPAGNEHMPKVTELIKQRISEQGKFPSPSEVWNLDDSYDWHNFLKNELAQTEPQSDVDYLHYTLKMTITADNFSQEINQDLHIATYAWNYFEDLSIGVTGITPELPNLEF